MIRLNAQFEALDVAAWPTVAHLEFDDATRLMFERRVQAVMAYVCDESIKQIEHSTGINRRQLYRWLELKVSEPPRRSTGVKVPDAKTLVEKLKTQSQGALIDAHHRKRRRFK